MQPLVMQCPRDQYPLLRRDYFFQKQWACQKCQGTFLFRENIKRIPSLQIFFDLLKASSTNDPVPCPKCKCSMTRLNYDSTNGSVEIDYCENCTAYWFDSGELKQVESSTNKTGEELSPNNQSAVRIYLAWERDQREKREAFARNLRWLSFVLIVFCIVVYIKTYEFGYQYSGSPSYFRQTLPPHTSALVSLFLLTIGIVSPHRFWLVLLPVAWLIFTATFIWVSRYSV